jgi:hypothetical protein
MKLGSLKTALLAASILGSTAIAPITAALADTPSTATNATVIHTAGAYDSFDKFKDSTGRPLAGWQYLIYAANSNG